MMLLTLRRWLRARMTLGWALAKHVMMGPWAKRRTDPGRWLRRIGAEALGPTPEGNWPRFAGSSKCIGCGLCDLFGSQNLPRPSLVIRGAARLPSDAPHISPQTLEALGEVAADVARICPQGVQVEDIVTLIRNNQQALSEALGTDRPAGRLEGRPQS